MTRPRVGLAALAAAAVYALMWLGYLRQWGWLHSLDWSLLSAAHDIGVKHPAWVRFWVMVSFALGPTSMRLLGLVAALAAAAMRNLRAALLLLACGPLSEWVTTLAKHQANRPRPPMMLVEEHSSAFPSGHALEASATLLALLSCVLPMIRRSGIAITVTVLSVLLVGSARVALNVHHPSDVIAGWSLGYLYFLVCLMVFRPVITARAPGEV